MTINSVHISVSVCDWYSSNGLLGEVCKGLYWPLHLFRKTFGVRIGVAFLDVYLHVYVCIECVMHVIPLILNAHISGFNSHLHSAEQRSHITSGWHREEEMHNRNAVWMHNYYNHVEGHVVAISPLQLLTLWTIWELFWWYPSKFKDRPWAVKF